MSLMKSKRTLINITVKLIRNVFIDNSILKIILRSIMSVHFISHYVASAIKRMQCCLIPDSKVGNL